MGGLLFIHIAISLVGIASGFIVAGGMLGSKHLRGWAALFLATTALTSLTGFPLPAKQFMPAHALGILSIIALTLAIYALYARKLSGKWRGTYVVTALIAQYFNFFVLVVQLFEKVPGLKALAPTQTEPPFAIVQGMVLVLFIVLGALAVRRFRPVHGE
jgi:hypothetical protein